MSETAWQLPDDFDLRPLAAFGLAAADLPEAQLLDPAETISQEWIAALNLGTSEAMALLEARHPAFPSDMMSSLVAICLEPVTAGSSDGSQPASPPQATSSAPEPLSLGAVIAGPCLEEAPCPGWSVYAEARMPDPGQTLAGAGWTFIG